MELKPLGDQAVLAYLPDEAAAVRFAAGVRAAAPPWLHDVVPAYASVGVFFDADAANAAGVIEWLKTVEMSAPGFTSPPTLRGGRGRGALAPQVRGSDSLGEVPPPSPGVAAPPTSPPTKRWGRGEQPSQHTIPVCYEMQLDAARVCEHAALPFDDVIRLHTSTPFTVYAIGFVPGFPYLGYLPPELCGVGRLPSPRTRVEPGSVGLTGRQTGIYPLPRPGGWNLIGRTPLTIVDVADGFFPIRVGDTVRFERIDEAQFRQLLGERLGRGSPEKSGTLAP